MTTKRQLLLWLIAVAVLVKANLGWYKQWTPSCWHGWECEGMTYFKDYHFVASLLFVWCSFVSIVGWAAATGKMNREVTPQSVGMK